MHTKRLLSTLRNRERSMDYFSDSDSLHSHKWDHVRTARKDIFGRTTLAGGGKRTKASLPIGIH